MEADTVATAIQLMMAGKTDWRGTATALREALETTVGEKTARSKEWKRLLRGTPLADLPGARNHEDGVPSMKLPTPNPPAIATRPRRKPPVRVKLRRVSCEYGTLHPPEERNCLHGNEFYRPST
jgi:hypothetical protein